MEIDLSYKIENIDLEKLKIKQHDIPNDILIKIIYELPFSNDIISIKYNLPISCVKYLKYKLYQQYRKTLPTGFIKIPTAPTYAIDKFGNVMNISKRMIMKPFLTMNGYYRINLISPELRARKFFIHRLVADTFIQNNDVTNKTQINHINGIKTDNRVENLQWVTPSENINHAVKLGLFNVPKGENNGMSKLTEQDVKNIRHLYQYKTIKELSIKYNVSTAAIRKILNKKRWKHVS